MITTNNIEIAIMKKLIERMDKKSRDKMKIMVMANAEFKDFSKEEQDKALKDYGF